MTTDGNEIVTETEEIVAPQIVNVDPKIKKGHFIQYLDVRVRGLKNILRSIRRSSKHKASHKKYVHTHNLSRGELNHTNFVDESQGQIDI